MSSIAYLPLDERPCNFLYPQMVAEMTDLELVSPDESILGNKKEPADFEKIKSWLLKVAKQADRMIISIDMLVYGGIVPSRIHCLTMDQCHKRLNVIAQIKKENPNIKIDAFNLIMRVPAYNNSDEEPHYYQHYGRNIYLYGWFEDKTEHNELNRDEQYQFEHTKKGLPQKILEDFTDRRRTNAKVNQSVVEFVDKGFIDDLIIPLDDNSEYGFSSREQRQLLFMVERLNLLDRVLIYPGADEMGCLLFAKAFCEIKQYIPKVYARYSSTFGPYMIPDLEDRSLNETLKAHLISSHALIVDDEEKADMTLMLHSPAVGQSDIAGPIPYQNRHRSYFSEIGLREFTEFIRNMDSSTQTIALADVATLNGGDHSLMKLLSKMNLIDKIDSYAGWNTSSNTLGTVIAHAIINAYYKKRGKISEILEKSREFYFYRLVEDWGYQSIVRQNVAQEDLPQLGGNYFDLSNVQGKVEQIVHYKLDQFIQEYLSNGNDDKINIKNVKLPWNRMFEIQFALSLSEDS